MKQQSEITTLHIVRHGETEWNKRGLLQGNLDSPLSELGIMQAEALSRHFTKCEWDLIMCSDLPRAMRTAEIICGSDTRPVITDIRLRERNLGIAQGLTLDGFAERYPDDFRKFNECNVDYQIPDGESIRQRYIRSTISLNDLALEHCGKTVVVVTHGGILDSVFRHITGMALETRRSFSLFNASVNTIQISNGE